MICKGCGENMEGDGYSTAIHCPDSDDGVISSMEPDANPLHCRGVSGNIFVHTFYVSSGKDYKEIVKVYYNYDEAMSQWNLLGGTLVLTKPLRNWCK